MKSKSKKQQRLATVFLKDVLAASQTKFDRLSLVLERYENSEVDSGGALRLLLRELRLDPRLVARVNDLLDDDHKVRFISEEQSINLITRIFEVMQGAVCDQDKEKYNRFLMVVTNTSKRLDNGLTTSLEEFGADIVEDVRAEMPDSYWGAGFLETLERTIRDFVKGCQATKNGVNGASHGLPHASERQAADPRPPGKPSALEPGQGRAKPKPHSSTPLANGGVSLPPLPPLLPAVSHAESSPPHQAEEPQLFNLRIESEVILALKAKLSAVAFTGFVKTLALYFSSIISFQELVAMNHRSFLEADKEICLALRELIESRAAPIHKRSIFNIRLADFKSDDQTHNRKYFKIISPIFGSDQTSNPLINKTYVAIASGHESAVPNEETVVTRAPKNLSEEALYKVEDEMHEVDCTMAQFRMTVALLDRIMGGSLTDEAVAKAVQKIACTRTVHHLYGVRTGQVLEELKRRQRQVGETVRQRLLQRIQFLEVKKRELVDGTWAGRMSGNFYKALDVRSNCLKTQERLSISNKALVEQLKSASYGGPLIKSWLARLLGHRPEELMARLEPTAERAYCWSPVFCVSLADPDILADVYTLIKVFVKQSKANNSEKTKCNAFLDKAIGAFLEIPRPSPLALQPIPPEELQSALSGLERLLCPAKEFFLSDKVAIKLNPEGYKAMEDFNLASVEGSESKGDRSPDSNPVAEAPPAPLPHPSSDPDQPVIESLPSDREEGGSKDNFNVSREFKDLIDSNNSESREVQEMTVEFVPFDPSRRAFYSSYHFYVVYYDFVLLYERLSFAWTFAQNSPAGAALYDVFKRLLFMSLFGAVDETGFEDGVRMMFGSNGGVLLNFERILTGLLKHVPADDFANFVLELSPQLFGERGKSLVPPEPVVFARTCFKLNEMTSRENKGAKANHFTTFNNNFSLAGNELVKFEFDTRTGLFLVHKVRSLFAEGKKVAGGSLAAVEAQYGLLTRPMRSVTRKGGKLKKLVANNLTYAWDPRRRAMEVRSGQWDDLLLAPRPATPVETRKHRINKNLKPSRFREIVARFHPWRS